MIWVCHPKIARARTSVTQSTLIDTIDISAYLPHFAPFSLWRNLRVLTCSKLSYWE